MHPIEAVVQGLVGLWRNERPVAYEVDGKPTTLEVVDGPPIDDPVERRVLYVGSGGEMSEGTTQGMGYDLAGQTMTIDVGGELLVWGGEHDAAQVRADALDTMRQLDERLQADRTFGGTVDWARFTRQVLLPLAFAGGSGASVQWIVRVQANRPHA